jgi:tetratricopeptide (TPR) repeat protein
MPDIKLELRRSLKSLKGHFLNHAEVRLRGVRAVEPENPVMLHLLGITVFKLGRREEGIALLRRAAEAQADRPAVWLDLAVALRDGGDRAEAEKAYARGLAVLPADVRRESVPPLDVRPFSTERAQHKFKLVDYEYTARVRYGAGRPPHRELERIIGAGRDRYAAFIDEVVQRRADFLDVAASADDAEGVPFWFNEWFPPLDGMALQTMLCTRRPRLLLEVGSGLSTKFARAAIARHGLGTRIVSIDPQPRYDIDRLVDETIRHPLEEVAPEWFDRLGENDILFIDSSHRAFQNSDVTMFFLDVLPRLAPGVIVHVHDVYLPYDYLAAYLESLWNEQYLLATALLYGGAGLEILFPCWYATQDPELSSRLNAGLRRESLASLHIWGVSFWLRKH